MHHGGLSLPDDGVGAGVKQLQHEGLPLGGAGGQGRLLDADDLLRLPGAELEGPRLVEELVLGAPLGGGRGVQVAAADHRDVVGRLGRAERLVHLFEHHHTGVCGGEYQ